jgi:hypothetical protein
MSMRGKTSLGIAAVLALGVVACGGEASGDNGDGGRPAPVVDASTRDTPEDLGADDIGTGTLMDAGDAGDASDGKAAKDASGDGDASEPFVPCPPPPDDDGSIVPPPRPCDASTPPPPPP